MKKKILTILPFLFATLFIGCDSYLINGQLDGMWQLHSIERQSPDTLIYNEGDLFYSFQRHSVLIGDYSNPHELVGQMKNEQYISLFDYTDDTITIDEFHRYYKREDQPSDTTRLKRFGIFTKQTIFHIEELTSKRLILQSDSALITLHKY